MVINNGPAKGGEPRSFAAVKATPSVRAIYQLHRNLADAASNPEPAHIANVEAECAGQPLKLSVDPGGKSYVVTVPSTGHTRRYTVR